MFIGNQYLVSYFQELAKKQRLAHAYAFYGEEGVGKCCFAKQLAYFLERGLFDEPKHLLQDVLIIDGRNGIDAAREAKPFLWQAPVLGGKRIVILDNADELNEQAQNSILKIIEEPPEHALLLIIVRQPDNLLPALISRLQKIYFGRVSDGEMRPATMAGHVINKEILDFAAGRPGRLRISQEDALYREALKYSSQFLKTNGPQRSQMIKELVELQKERPLILDRFFEILILELRKTPLRHTDLLRSVLSRLFYIKSYNTNKRLQLEAIS